MGIFSRVRQRHPSTLVVQSEIALEEIPPPRKRGRPLRACGRPKPVAVKHPNFLNLRKADFPQISPATWNVLVSLIRTLFLSLLRVVGRLQPEAPGAELERTLFREIPELFHEFIRELAQWWWSNPDRGNLGTRLTCPCCHAGKLEYKGDVARKIVTLFGTISPTRAYYYCPDCKKGLAPLDERLGLDQDSFLPGVREVVTWLTSMDPYGKCLEFVAKLLQFSVSPRSAWLITQRVADRVKSRCDGEVAKAFADPANPRLPEPEVSPPQIGVVMVDGTMGRIGKSDDEKEKIQTPTVTLSTQADGPEETAEAKEKPGFREIKVGLAGHLVPAKKKPTNKKPRKKKDDTDRPTLGMRKYAVHLGLPLALFQMLLLQVCRLGLHKAQTLLVIADGARWIWNGVKEHFTSLGVELVEILDFWHAVEHLWELSRALFAPEAAKAWVSARKDQLLQGNLDEFFAALKNALSQADSSTAIVLRAEKRVTVRELAQETLTYFRNNESRIRYHEYLAKGYLIGSGAMEGANKHLIKERVHRSGMRWLPDGCMSVLRNRILIKSDDWDDFWAEEANRRQTQYLHLKTTLQAA